MLKHSERCHDIAAPSKQPSEKEGTRGGEKRDTKLWQKVNMFVVLFCQFCMLERFAK